MELRADEVHVWFVLSDRVTDPRLLAALDATLSVDEQVRRGRFVFEKDRHQFLVARGLLRRLLGRYLDVDPRVCAFVTNDHGRPSLAPGTGEPRVEFNVSHTNGVIAV